MEYSKIANQIIFKRRIYMQVVLLTLVATMVVFANVTILLSLYTKKLEKKFKVALLGNILVIDVCNNMIKYYNMPEIQIKQLVHGTNSYIPLKNIITLKKILQNTVANLIVATHEVGHYIDFKGNSFYTKIARKTIFLMSINRLLVIPFFIVNFFYSKIFFPKSSLSLPVWLMCLLTGIFYTASFIRIVTCIPLENNASKIAISYIYDFNLIKEENVVDIKKFYLIAACGQMALTLSYFVLVTVIIMISF
jgi:Zn-dependent membrane protease YugP